MKTPAQIVEEMEALKKLGQGRDELTKASIAGQINALGWALGTYPVEFGS